MVHEWFDCYDCSRRRAPEVGETRSWLLNRRSGRANSIEKESNKVPKTYASAPSSSNKSTSKSYCKFCRKVGHKQSKCSSFKEWLAKKGNHLNMIIESFNLNVPTNTWWFDLVLWFVWPIQSKDSLQSGSWKETKEHLRWGMDKNYLSKLWEP